MRRAVHAVFVAALALAPVSAMAHPGAGLAHDLAHGFAHPWTGLDHVLAMVAVGLIAARRGGRALWLVPGTFLVAMTAAGAAAVAGLALPGAEAGIAVSVIVLGAAIAIDKTLPVAAATAMAGIFALFHGYAHGAELAGEASAVGYFAGFVAATALLHLLGIGIGLAIGRAPDSARMARIAGSATALIGAGIFVTL